MKQWLVRIGLALLALCLAAYLIVPNWILAKPREALIEAVRQELAAAVEAERFEDAAALRDRIRELEQEAR